MIEKKLIKIKMLSKNFVKSLIIPCSFLWIVIRSVPLIVGICKVGFFPMGWSVIRPCRDPYRDSRGFGKISHQPCLLLY